MTDTVCDSNRVTNFLGSERSQKPSSDSEASDLKKVTGCTEDIKVLLTQFTDNINNKISSLEEKLQGLVEVNNRLVHENICNKGNNNVIIPSIQTKTTTTESKILIVEKHEDNIKISGKTYTHRSLLREEGGSWNKSLQAWIFPEDTKDKLLEILKEKEIEHEVKF